MAYEVLDEATHLFSGETNMSFTERAVSVVAGLAVAAIGAQPRPSKLLSLAAILAGSALAIRGATGHCGVKAMLGMGPRGALEDHTS